MIDPGRLFEAFQHKYRDHVLEELSMQPLDPVLQSLPELEKPLTDENSLHQLNNFLARWIPASRHYNEGIGIVTCAGGIKYFPSAWVCIKMLRRLGCTLPIELWHLGPQEVNDWMRELLGPLGVRCIDANLVRNQNPVRILNGWELKPFAIIHSRFREVLFLDADNVPVQDPTFLFQTQEYLEHGAIFWPDFSRLSQRRQIWRLTGVSYRDEPEFESGQIVVDKSRCEDALALTMWFNEHSDYWYRHIHGDKETFHLAWRKLNKPYAMPHRGIEAIPSTMCQHDFRGQRLFQHRNMAKWKLRGNVAVPRFEFEQECLQYLEELVPHWKYISGISVYSSTDRSPAELSLAQELFKNEWVYDRVNHDERTMSFNEDGTILAGAAEMEVFWNLSQVNGEIKLEIQSADSVTCRLRRQSSGVWTGKWEKFERMPVELRPIRRKLISVNVPSFPPVVGVTIATGTRYLQYAIRAARSVQEKAGLPTCILGANFGDVSPTALRLRLFEYFTGTVFYFDADTILLQPFDVTKYANSSQFVCVHDRVSPGIREDCLSHNLKESEYFNAGIFIANKRHHEAMFAEAVNCQEIKSRRGVHTILNLAAKRHGTPMTLLADRFNYVAAGKRGCPADTVIAHAGADCLKEFDQTFPEMRC
jgi:hypothetical protein